MNVFEDHHTAFSKDWYLNICQSVNGLIFLMYERRFLKIDRIPIICNPSTGQQLCLPNPTAKNIDLISFFGYDPIGKEYKVLCMTVSRYRNQTNSREHEVLTLGKGTLLWRKIKCSFPHYPEKPINEICINGVLYYKARSNTTILIACFDVRSEKFSYINIEEDTRISFISELLNYKGKLCVLMDVYGGPNELWVLNDTEKGKWSKHIYVWPNADHEIKKSIWINDRGEISWVLNRWTSPFYIYFYNLETTIHRRVEIRGIEEKLGMDEDLPEKHFIFMDHVENLLFLS